MRYSISKVKMQCGGIIAISHFTFKMLYHISLWATVSFYMMSFLCFAPIRKILKILPSDGISGTYMSYTSKSLFSTYCFCCIDGISVQFAMYW